MIATKKSIRPLDLYLRPYSSLEIEASHFVIESLY